MENLEHKINEARSIVESFDPGGGMSVGFDEATYTLTAEQMTTIAGALYLADCAIVEKTEAGMQLMKLAELYQARSHEIEDISLELLTCPWWNFVKLIKLEKKIHEAILRYNSEHQLGNVLNKLESIFEK
jgi:hypothetical protein